MANYPGSGITRSPYPRGPGVYGVSVAGNLQLGNITIGSNDTLQLCYIPQNCYIGGFNLLSSAALDGGGNTLSLRLVDTLASPTTYIPTGTGWNAAKNLGAVNFSAAVFGTTYAATARAIGPLGPPVVVWTPGVLLQLQATAGAAGATGGTINITYQVTFHPAYDAGV